MSRPVRKRPTRRPKADPSSTLAAELIEFIRRYVVMSEAQFLVTALYVVHTHLCGVCDQTPYLSISSPERECGKSRLMEVLELLVARPWMIVNPSEAVLFRMVDSKKPTLLWDEIDTVFAPANARYNEGHRALLDQGHRRYGKVPRFINKVVTFNVFCPKVLAGIGALPDTIASRSIPIRLQRRKPSEPIRDFIRRDIEPEARELATRLNEWAEEFAPKVEVARPVMPSEISDRMKEGCESLVAIADLLGCGEVAREALVELLASGDRVDSQETMRLRLLRDLRTVFAAYPGARGIRTTTLLMNLASIEEAPWARYYGRELDANDLSGLLRHYGVGPKPIKLQVNGKPEVAKGYRRDELEEVWERYLGEVTE